MCNGKAIDELIFWQFDEELEESRKEIQEYGMLEKDILEDKIERYIKAHFPPKGTPLAYRIYSFIRNHANLTTTTGGMQSMTTGLDKSKLQALSESFGLDYGAISPFVNRYEQAMLEKQQRIIDQSNN